MRIGIDARMFGPGYGLGRYVEQLIKHLEKNDRENEYVVFMKNDTWDLWKPKYDNFKKVKANIHWYTFAEQLKLKSIIKKEQIDLMHFPHWNIPIFFNDPFVVTIHDLTMFHFARPEASTRSRLIFWLKDKVHRWVVGRVVKKALHIITTSDFTKQDVHRTLSVSLDRMTTVYQSPFQEDGWKKTDREIVKKHGITK
ncbi:glycosyltransferase, partial [Candidatus Parcubacteria bacterium]|nr:glycosyltransferase [Candidatus Parcubacteria bacterium]